MEKELGQTSQNKCFCTVFSGAVYIAPIIVPILPTKPMPKTAPAYYIVNIDSYVERSSLAWVGGHNPERYSRIEETSRCQGGKKKTTSGVFKSVIKQALLSERQRIPGFSVQ